MEMTIEHNGCNRLVVLRVTKKDCILVGWLGNHVVRVKVGIYYVLLPQSNAS